VPSLAETFAKICNISFSEGVFPQNLKQALVRPQLKKSTLDPDDLNSYRPISNLTFLSEAVEQAAAVRLRHHVESERLLPYRRKRGVRLVVIIPLSTIRDFLRKWTVSWSIQCGLQRPSRICFRPSEVHRIYQGPGGPDPQPPSQLPFIRRRHPSNRVNNDDTH